MAERQIAPVVAFSHTTPRDEAHPGRRPCGRVAHYLDTDWMTMVVSHRVRLYCNGCGRRVTLDDLEGDEPFVPAYVSRDEDDA